MAECPEYERLRTEVEDVLGNLAQTTTLILELFFVPRIGTASITRPAT